MALISIILLLLSFVVVVVAFSLFALPPTSSHIVLCSPASMYDNFNTGFGTVTLGGKFDNRVRRLHGLQVYKYPLASRMTLKLNQ